MNMSHLLSLENVLPNHLTKTKAKDSDYLHLSLKRGEVFVIFGPEGSGKYQLLSCLSGLSHFKQGRVLFNGEPLKKLTGHERGFVPRVPGVYEELQVWEFLDFFAQTYRVDSFYRQPLISTVLRVCDLQGFEKRRIDGLSFAQKKRLSLARAVLPDPHVLFLDDPFDQLDRNEQTVMRQVLTRVQERGTTLVATAPCLGEFSEIASFLCVLTSKRVLSYGPINQLRASLSCFKMMQVQFESGFRKAVKALDGVASVHHLSVSHKTANLVRFLFKGTDTELTDLLRSMAQEGATIVSYVEDQEFLGRGGLRPTR